MGSRNRSPRKAILCVSGEGGHMTELKALMNILGEDLSDYRLVLITDTKKYASGVFDRVYVCGALRDKDSYLKTCIRAPVTIMRSIIAILEVNFRFRPFIMLSTGPGVAVLPTLVMRTLGVPTIHFECSARFYSISPSGRIIAALADKFYVQNEGLTTLNRKASYCGLLIT